MTPPPKAEDGHAALITTLFEMFLGRTPSPEELARWVETSANRTAAQVVQRLAATPGALRRRGVKSFFPAGHFHSPVVDPDTLGDYVATSRKDWPAALEAISVDRGGMVALLAENLDAVNALDLPETAPEGRRYGTGSGPFPSGDAASLWLMMTRHRPKRIIEVGSGYSTAAALDFAEDLGIEGFRMTCIEPYPDRLKSLLLPGDEARVEIIESFVQDIPSDIVADLEPGDFFFIDSTHVLKTGSDVHHEFFHMLPKVPKGVVVHVHDVPFPFEYPEFWVEERNYSWNEAYALRAFLMFNPAFRVAYWGGMLKQTEPALFARLRWYQPNAGSSIWIERVA